MTQTPDPLILPAKANLKYFFGAAIFIGGLHALNAVSGWPFWVFRFWFDLDREGTVGAWFSSFLWALCALTAYQCRLLEMNAMNRFWWGLGALGLLVFSMDETASIHERIGVVVYNAVNRPGSGMHLHLNRTYWPFVLAPLLLMGLCFCLYFGMRTFPKASASRRKAIGAIALVFLAAVILDALSDSIDPQKQFFLNAAEMIGEEVSEMLGAILFLNALISRRAELQHEAEEKLKSPQVRNGSYGER